MGRLLHLAIATYLVAIGSISPARAETGTLTGTLIYNAKLHLNGDATDCGIKIPPIVEAVYQSTKRSGIRIVSYKVEEAPFISIMVDSVRTKHPQKCFSRIELFVGHPTSFHSPYINQKFKAFITLFDNQLVFASPPKNHATLVVGIIKAQMDKFVADWHRENAK